VFGGLTASWKGYGRVSGCVGSLLVLVLWWLSGAAGAVRRRLLG